MKWSICIITVPERSLDLIRIKGILEYQMHEAHVPPGDIEILVNDQKGDVGKKRQWCLDNARGEYISFIDDDDLVSHDFVETIYELLHTGVDYIGFQVQTYEDGKRCKPTFHSLKYDKWSEDASGWYRNVSHLNPIKTDIARQGKFSGTYGEDAAWARQVHPITSLDVDRPLYFYFHSKDYSLTRKK